LYPKFFFFGKVFHAGVDVSAMLTFNICHQTVVKTDVNLRFNDAIVFLSVFKDSELMQHSAKQT